MREAENTAQFVLVPGAGGAAWYWHLLEPELQRRGHRVVAADLPAGDDAAGLPDYADAVVAEVRAAELSDSTPIVLVAQSMGGFTAPLVCERIGVSMLVFCNAMIPVPGETPGQWWEATGQAVALRANNVREGRPAEAEFDPLTFFFHDVPANVYAEAMQSEPAQSNEIFSSLCFFEQWPEIPVRAIAGRDDRFFPIEFQRRVAMDRLGIEADELDGGHLMALSRPAELAARLNDFLDDLQ